MLKIYNTLTRKKEDFLPTDTQIRMFVCGPTVYDYLHIGNARTAVFFDVIAKWLRYIGYDLNFLENITDIDDKIIAHSQETGDTWSDLAKKYENIYHKDMEKLGVTAVNEHPRATEYIEEIKKQVQTLLDKGNAYIIENDGIYFDLTTFPNYGKLSGRTAEMAEDGVSRIDDSPNKRNKGDFAIWKFSKKGEPSWDALFGAGRPGWHIEDTAITEKHFGSQYELHGAGIDLMFPHHEAEIALQESISGKKPFVKYWMHAGYLTMKGGKMSKSKGNFLTLHEALEKHSPEALRFYFLSAHYRSSLEYSEENIISAEAGTQRLAEFVTRLNNAYDQLPDSDDSDSNIDTQQTKEAIETSMDDDFNVPKVFSHLFELIKQVNPLIDSSTLSKKSTDEIKKLFETINDVLSIIPSQITGFPDNIQNLINQREQARKNKDYDLADKLRDNITSQGYSIDDTPYGSLIKK
ncbi:MAG: cysteine--tRNA ligase [Parcubacteria group bacterium]